MKQERPVNLSLSTIRFPIAAIVSILHRLSGVVLFLLIPFMLWVFGHSMLSEEGFLDIQDCLTSLLGKCIIWLVLSALVYHLLAGIRHLLMDAGVGETRSSGSVAAKITLILGVVCALLLGVWLW